MFTRRAKPIQIIGNPDNQRPIKWSSTVFVIKFIVWTVTNIRNAQVQKFRG
jgi:hypothetical protein